MKRYAILIILSCLLLRLCPAETVPASFDDDPPCVARVADFYTSEDLNAFIGEHSISGIERIDVEEEGYFTFLVIPAAKDIKLRLTDSDFDEDFNIFAGDHLYGEAEAGRPILFTYTVPEGVPSLVVTAVDEQGRSTYWHPEFSGMDGHLIMSEGFIHLNPPYGDAPVRGDTDIYDDIPMEYADMFFTPWTNGFEYIEFVSKDIKEMMGVENAAWGENMYLFLGGTPHEGGSHLWLTESSGKMLVADRSDWQLFPAGSIVDFDTSHTRLIVRQANSGKLLGVLKAFPEDVSIKEEMSVDMTRFLLAGTYWYQDELKYEFSDFASYTFKESFDIPVPVIEINDELVRVRKTSEGLELITVEPDEYEEEYEPVPDREKIVLIRANPGMERRYPLVSDEIMTASQLLLYAGHDPYSVDLPLRSEEALRQLEALATMRNEIFAAHGYIFNSKKWNDLFKSTEWYHPQHKDVTSMMSEAETINVEHLRLLEENLKKEFESLY